MTEFDETGWLRFGRDPELARWVEAVRPAALATLEAPDYAHWWRNERTWFVGVNALDNDETGAVAGGPPLSGQAQCFARETVRAQVRWDRAQVSAIRTGYPRRGEDSAAAFDFRKRRDAAHIDGLMMVDGKRKLLEPQAFLLGIPLVDTTPGASPLVLWEGSHKIMAQALGEVLRKHPVARWGEVDLTKTYKTARRRCFRECRRVELHAGVGEAYLLHRLTLHGVSPWQDGAVAPDEGRVVVYFRPVLEDLSRWPQP